MMLWTKENKLHNKFPKFPKIQRKKAQKCHKFKLTVKKLIKDFSL